MGWLANQSHTTKFCRVGFHQQYYKPAPTQAITYMNLDFVSRIPKTYKSIYGPEWGRVLETFNYWQIFAGKPALTILWNLIFFRFGYL